MPSNRYQITNFDLTWLKLLPNAKIMYGYVIDVETESDFFNFEIVVLQYWRLFFCVIQLSVQCVLHTANLKYVVLKLLHFYRYHFCFFEEWRSLKSFVMEDTDPFIIDIINWSRVILVGSTIIQRNQCNGCWWSGEYWWLSKHDMCINDLGAVSIRKTVLPGMAIPMLKIRRPNGRLIFNMEIAIRR